MINSGTYQMNATHAAIKPLAIGDSVDLEKKNDLQDAAAAADFERILRAAAPSSTSSVQKTAGSAPANSADHSAAQEHPFLSFIKGIIDVINPLQHIPVVSAIYRHMTGDEISPMAKLAGDALYGGPIGGAVAIADIAYQKMNGQDIGETVIAKLKNPSPAAEPDVQVAENLNNQISPAAGETQTINKDEIIWSTPYARNMPPSPVESPLSTAPTGTVGEEPVPHRMPAPSVLHMKGNVSAFQPLTASEVDSTAALQAQEAPVDTARTAVSPEPIAAVPKEMVAAKMMEALDKYTEMKRQAPSLLSASY